MQNMKSYLKKRKAATVDLPNIFIISWNMSDLKLLHLFH